MEISQVDRLFPCSSVLGCYIHLLPSTTENCCPYLSLQISFPGVLLSSYSAVVLQKTQRVRCSSCLEILSSLLHMQSKPVPFCFYNLVYHGLMVRFFSTTTYCFYTPESSSTTPEKSAGPFTLVVSSRVR